MDDLSWATRMHQQRELTSAAATSANDKADRVTRKVVDLEKEIEELTLACQAMWELLRDHLGFTDDHLRAKILEVDVRDGKLDGKIGLEFLACPSCGQAASATKDHCVYCGEKLPSSHVMK